MTWTTNHNKAEGRGWSVSQSWHHAMTVSHIGWHLLVATVWVASSPNHHSDCHIHIVTLTADAGMVDGSVKAVSSLQHHMYQSTTQYPIW